MAVMGLKKHLCRRLLLEKCMHWKRLRTLLELLRVCPMLMGAWGRFGTRGCFACRVGLRIPKYLRALGRSRLGFALFAARSDLMLARLPFGVHVARERSLFEVEHGRLKAIGVSVSYS